MRKIIIIAIFSIFCHIISSAQKESNNWYFGNQAGLNFDQGNPVAVNNGSLNMQEGCSAISDSEGNLLFYTDGMHVWNKNHFQMPNGFELAGAPSSTSTAIIPKPGNKNIYYIISVDENVGTKGLSYSMINMQLDNGLGDVDPLTKNTLIFTPASEKIAVTLHENGKDYWLIVHKWNSDEFVSYLVNESGIQTGSPVISPRGTVYEGHVSNSRGYIKVSPKGDKLAAAIEGMNILEIFDFDNATGVISNYLKFPGVYTSAYGVEFSLDGKFLYCSERWGNTIYQFNLGAGTNENIFASETIIGYNGTGMQMGMDGRIYMASGGNSLSVINNPASPGSNSNYGILDFGSNRQNYEGLPSFINSYFSGLKFTYKKACQGFPTKFNIPNTSEIQSVEWYFNYPSEDGSDKSNSFSPEHIYYPGTYKIRLVATYPDRTETAEQTITIDAIPEIILPESKELCIGDFVEVNGFSFYEWSNGSLGNRLYPLTTGTYWVTAKNQYGCFPPVPNKSINVIVNPKPSINYSKTNVSTVGGSSGTINLTVTGGTNPYSYIWNNGAITEDLYSLKAGSYSVKVEDSKHCIANEGIDIEGPFSCEATSHSWSQLIYSESSGSGGFGRDIATDDFGNIYISGSGGYKFSQAGVNYSGNCNGNLLLSKFDSSGKLIWIKYFCIDLSIFISKMALDKGGNIFITGYFKGSIDFDGNKITALENDDIFIAKFDKNGRVLWAKRAGGTLKDHAIDITTDNQGNAYIFGEYAGSAVFADTTIISNGENDLFLAKYNLSGEVEWVRSIGGVNYETANSISINPLNDIYIAGRSDSWVCNFDNLILEPGTCFTAKYNTVGKVDKIIKLPYSTSQIVATSKNLFMMGDYRGGTTFGTFTLNGPIDQYGTVISKLSLNGDYIWSKQASSLGVGGPSDFFVDNKDNSYILEYFWQDTYYEGQLFKYESFPENTSPCVAIAKYGTNGNFIYADKITIANYQYSQVWTTAICADKMQNIFVTGYFTYSPQFGNLTTPFPYFGLFAAKHSDNKLKTLIPETSFGCTNQSALLNLMVEGGTQPYNYIWSTGETTQNINISQTGNYSVTVTDSKSCIATDSLKISVSGGIYLKTQIVNASSGRAKDGKIDLKVTGGEPPFIFSWSNGATSEDLINIEPGEYTVHVTDKNGCSASTSAIVTKADNPMKLELTGTYDCAGSNKGSIDLTISGGSGNYQILWSNGATTEDISGLSAGWYYVTVQDNDFSANDSILLNGENVIQTKLKVNDDCENASNGRINLDVKGGASPYSYLWSNNETTQNIKDLTAGFYSVIVTDANTCTAYDTAEVKMQYLPNKAAPIKGTNELCLNEKQVNLLSTNLIENASYYDWEVIPSVAGSIKSDGTKSIIDWNKSYIGEVEVMVSGRNNCGNGNKSEPLNLKILNPAAKLTCAETIPPGDSVLMSIDLIGTPPWNFTYTDGTISYTETTNISPFQKWISKDGIYKIESLSDANCNGYVLGKEVAVSYGPNLIKNLGFDDFVKIYPNPAKSKIKMEFKNLEEKDFQIDIVNLHGSIIFSKIYHSAKNIEEINLEKYARGAYTVKILFDNEIRTTKLILQ